MQRPWRRHQPFGVGDGGGGGFGCLMVVIAAVGGGVRDGIGDVVLDCALRQEDG